MPSTAKQKFKCAYCPQSFPRPASLGSHVYHAHPEHRRATAKPVSQATKEAMVTTGRPGPVFVHEPQTPAPAPTRSNSTLTHLDAAISKLEDEVEMDKQDLARLEALQRGISKKQDLLAALIKERAKFLGKNEPMK